MLEVVQNAPKQIGSTALKGATPVVEEAVASGVIAPLTKTALPAVIEIEAEEDIIPLEKKVATILKINIESLKEKIELEQEQKNIISSTSPLMLGDRAKLYIEKKTIEPNLEFDLNDEIKFVTGVDSSDKYGMAERASDYLNVLLIGVLLLMSVAMFLNIFVRIRVQHKPVLIQTFLLLVLLFGIYSTKLHFLEKLPNYIMIF
jgi:hypothetical protein